MSLRDTPGATIDFIGLRRYFLLISLVVLGPALAALAIWQFTPGIDFVGASRSRHASCAQSPRTM